MVAPLRPTSGLYASAQPEQGNRTERVGGGVNEARCLEAGTAGSGTLSRWNDRPFSIQLPVQEAIRNMLKYADATELSVDVTRGRGHISVIAKADLLVNTAS